LIKARLDAELALLKDGLKRQQTALDAALEDRLVSVRDYYAQKTALEQREIDAEIARKQQELARSQQMATGGKSENDRSRPRPKSPRSKPTSSRSTTGAPTSSRPTPARQRKPNASWPTPWRRRVRNWRRSPARRPMPTGKRRLPAATAICAHDWRRKAMPTVCRWWIG
jgi:hypothetical protein